MGNLNLYGRVAPTTGIGTLDVVARSPVPANSRIMLRRAVLNVISLGYARFAIQLQDAAGAVLTEFQTVIQDAVAGVATFAEDLEIPMDVPDDPNCSLVVLVETLIAAQIADASVSGRVA